MHEIRMLKETDALSFFNLRLEGLKLVPTAFGGDYAEEASAGPSRWEVILKKQDKANVIFGAFREGAMVGCIGVFRESGKKSEHKAMIWGMYVKKDQQGMGLGKKLMLEAIDHMKSLPGIKLINLTVEPNNHSAKKLYSSCGFKNWGTEPKALLIDGKYYAEDHMILDFES